MEPADDAPSLACDIVLDETRQSTGLRFRFAPELRKRSTCVPKHSLLEEPDLRQRNGSSHRCVGHRDCSCFVLMAPRQIWLTYHVLVAIGR